MKDEEEAGTGLDMEFGEALRRFIQTDPAELPSTVKVARAAKAKAIERAKANPETGPPVAREDGQKVERKAELAKRSALAKMPPPRRKEET